MRGVGSWYDGVMVESIVESIVEAATRGAKTKSASSRSSRDGCFKYSHPRKSKGWHTLGRAVAHGHLGVDDAAAGAGADGAIKLRAKPTAAPRRRALRPPRDVCTNPRRSYPTPRPRSRSRRLVFGFALGACIAALMDAAARRRAPGVAPSAADPPPPKIAFLFLTRGALPHDHLWARFFQDQDPATYAIHVHAPPDFTFDATTTSSPDALRLFRRVIIPNPVASTAWGAASVVLAEKRLLARALLDPTAERFVLLSESCVPIRPFPRVRAVLLDTDRSFVESSPDRHQRWPGAYDLRAAAEIPRATRKGSQWFAMTRHHANVVAGDERLFRAFERYCAANDPTARATARAVFGRVLRAGRTLRPDGVDVGGLERELENRVVTYANWAVHAMASETIRRAGGGATRWRRS